MLIEPRKHVFERCVFVEILFKTGNLTDEMVHLFFVLCGRHKEKNGVKVIFLGNDAVFSQVIRKNGGRHTEVFVLTGFDIDTRCRQHKFARIDKILALPIAFKRVPFFTGHKFKELQILRNKIRRIRLPVGASYLVRNKRLDVVAGIQQQLACIDSGLDAVGPKSAAGFTFLHFGVDIQRGKQRIEGTRGSVHHKGIVQHLVRNEAVLTSDVGVFLMNL